MHSQQQQTTRTTHMEKYIVNLAQEERDYLLNIVSKGKASAKKITHARILLQADESEISYKDSAEIAETLEISAKTVYRVRKCFSEEGLESAINRKPHAKYKSRRLDGAQEAHLIALACSAAPEGRSRWTMKLLAEKLVELEITESIGKTTVNEILKKTNLSRG